MYVTEEGTRKVLKRKLVGHFGQFYWDIGNSLDMLPFNYYSYDHAIFG